MAFSVVNFFRKFAGCEPERGQEEAILDMASAVTSHDQKNGVTAGYVNNLTQNVIPTLVRGPQLEKLKSIFVHGAQLVRAMRENHTDDEFIQIFDQCDKWLTTTYEYLVGNVSDYAAERFLFSGNSLSLSYSLDGNHSMEVRQKFSTYRSATNIYLSNLDQLMRDPSIYPEE